LITDRQRFAPPAPTELFGADEWRALDAAIAAGVGAVQLREKDLDGRALCARAERLAARCRASGVKLLVNERADVALAARADGVHLPEAGLPVAAVRALVGADRLVGCSVHATEQLAARSGADFVLFGPVYETPAKRAFGPPQGLDRLAAFAHASPLPVLAVGGITVARVPEVLRAGASGVALIGAILDATDPGAVVAAFRAALARG
jgi:thiamine-phosphate pyrophosphorylase